VAYAAAKPNPIPAYPSVNRFNSAGIAKVSKPSPNADTSITNAACLMPYSLAVRETTNIFPVSAIKVTAIMRIDQLSAVDCSSPSNWRNKLGEMANSAALKANTAAPTLKVTLNEFVAAIEFIKLDSFAIRLILEAEERGCEQLHCKFE